MSDLHVVRYVTRSGDRYLQTEPLSWAGAIALWTTLDERKAEMPWVRHFEVRSVDDPTNPAVTVKTRPWRDRDHPNNLRLRGQSLVENQRVYTFQCVRCGRAYQGSGLGVGSHSRACKI